MVNKKILVLTIFSIFLMSMFAGVVTAVEPDDDKGIISMLKEHALLKWIFVDLQESLLTDDVTTSGQIGARLIIAILVFSLLFGASEIALKGMAKGPRIGIAIALSIISSAAIPTGQLKALYTMWGGLIVIVLIAGPTIGLFYLAWTKFKEPTRANYAAKLILMMIVIWILSIGTGTGIPHDPAEASAISGYMSSMFGILSAITWFLFIWYIYRIISPGEAVVGEKGLGAAAEQVAGARKGWRKVRRAFRRGYRYEKKIVDDLKTIKDEASATPAPSDLSPLKDKIKDAQGKAAKMLGVQDYAKDMEEKLEEIANATKKKALGDQLKIYVKDLIKYNGLMIAGLDKADKETTAAGLATAANNCIPLGREVEKAILAIEALEGKITA